MEKDATNSEYVLWKEWHKKLIKGEPVPYVAMSPIGPFLSSFLTCSCSLVPPFGHSLAERNPMTEKQCLQGPVLPNDPKAC